MPRFASWASSTWCGSPVVVDAQERIVSWGPAAVEVFGWALDEALGRRIELLVPAERLPFHVEEGEARDVAGLELDEHINVARGCEVVAQDRSAKR
jgi:PAS domain S-box-containing protein